MNNQNEKLALLCHNLWWLLNSWAIQSKENMEAAQAHERIYWRGNETFLTLSQSSKNLQDARESILAVLEKSDICLECFECGSVDSGGFTPWGSPIDIPCQSCKTT